MERCSSTMNSATPVIEAVRTGNATELERLLTTGADPNEHTHYEVALGLAARMGLTEAVDLLLGHGGNPNQVNPSSGYTPLHEVGASGNTAVARLLLAAGAAVNSQDGCGWTPLYRAAEHDRRELAKLLFKNGGRIAVDMVPLVTELCREVFAWERTRAAPQYPACFRSSRRPGSVTKDDGNCGTLESRWNYISDEICTTPPGGWVVYIYVPTWRDRLHSLLRHPIQLGDIDMVPAIVYQSIAGDGSLIVIARPYRGLPMLFFDQVEWQDDLNHSIITRRVSPALKTSREEARERIASGKHRRGDVWMVRLIDGVPGLA
jgi:hypothetical protein